MTKRIVPSVVLGLSISTALLSMGTSMLTAHAAKPVYTQAASIDNAVGGRELASLAFDPKANRLYAGSRLGLYWVNVSDDKPVWKGPMFKAEIGHIEFAPQLGRVFFTSTEGVGYVNVDSLGEPKMISSILAYDLAYEPTRREVYVTSRASRVNVFDGATGEPGAAVEIPGWIGVGLEAVPGRVFLMQTKTQGIFTIDATTHALAPFTISEKITTPAYLEADPSGRYLFATYYQNIVAIDAATGKVVGRKTVPDKAAIAFDPGSGLLVATWMDDPTPVRVAAFRVDAGGLTEVEEFNNPRAGGIGVEPTSRGFVQTGVNRFYFWSAR